MDDDGSVAVVLPGFAKVSIVYVTVIETIENHINNQRP